MTKENIEIERRFLVIGDIYDGLYDKKFKKKEFISQFYLSTNPEKVIRLRMTTDNKTSITKAYMTVKGKNNGATRVEIETEVDVEFAKQLESMAEGFPVKKVRLTFATNNPELFWEVDIFKFPNEVNGLQIAEIELQSEAQEFDKPSWLGAEVTNDYSYSNSNIAKNGKVDSYVSR